MSLMIRRRAHAARLILLCVLISVAGCQSPSTQLRSFADATAELQSAVRAGGERTIAATAAAPFRDVQRRIIPPGDPKHPAHRLSALWQELTRAMDGLVAYADALASIAAAGDAAGANTAALGDAASQLSTFIPGAAGLPVAQGVSLAASIGAAAVQVRAADDLADAVARAHPAVEAIAGILRSDLADLSTQFRSASLAVERAADAEFGPRNHYRASLIARRGALREQVVSTLGSAGLDASTAALATVDGLIAGTDVDDAAYRQRVDALLAERGHVAELIAAASAGVAAWAGAHRDLQHAIDERRQPNLRVILAKAQEVRALIDALRRRDPAANAGKAR